MMSEKKGWGSTVLGWFIVQDESAAPADSSAASDPAVPAEEGGLPGAGPAFFQKDPPAAIGGRVDFDAVFEAAGIAEEERRRVAKTLDLLQSLPAETPVAVRKQIVEASLKAFGVPIEKIIEAGAGEIQALEGYIRAGAADTQQLLQQSAQRIQQYEAEIKQIRTVMDQRVQEQQAVVKACNDKKLTVQQVLEFFGQDAVARVVKQSPKLHEPGAAPSTT
jgi:hypothetical protein